jgi:hypothetical protein
MGGKNGGYSRTFCFLWKILNALYEKNINVINNFYQY